MTALARNSDPITSHMAAEHVIASGLNKRQAAQVLAALREHPGCTSFELARHMGVERAVTGRRLSELKARGDVENCQPKLCNIIHRKALTWRAVPYQTELAA